MREKLCQAEQRSGKQLAPSLLAKWTFLLSPKKLSLWLCSAMRWRWRGPVDGRQPRRQVRDSLCWHAKVLFSSHVGQTLSRMVPIPWEADPSEQEWERSLQKKQNGLSRLSARFKEGDAIFLFVWIKKLTFYETLYDSQCRATELKAAGLHLIHTGILKSQAFRGHRRAVQLWTHLSPTSLKMQIKNKTSKHRRPANSVAEM